MRFRETVFVLLLAGLVGAAVAVELLAPAPVDWTDSFEHGDARPYGSEALYAVLPDLFPQARLEPVPAPPYLHLRDTTRTGTHYVFVADRFAPDPAETEALLDYVARGNTAFVAARAMAGPWADSLGVATRPVRPTLRAPTAGGPAQDTVRLQFAAPPLRRAGGYPLRSDALASRFIEVDTGRTTALAGALAADSASVDRGRLSYVRVRHGKGTVFLATTPRAFTNVHVLAPQSRPFAVQALSYLDADARALFWDAHHKPLAVSSGSPLRYVLSQPALRTAWWLLLGGVGLFLLVRARRRQRVIPVREPPENATLAFVETVGALYRRQAEPAELARKKMRYVLASIRDRLDVDTPSPTAIDDVWVDRVARRSGAPRAVVRRLAETLRGVDAADAMSADELHEVADRLQAFRNARRR
jgi:hypothetical protein